MSHTHKPRDEVYAVLRLDDFHVPDVPAEERVTVKEVVWSEELALAEVRRLNSEAADETVRYWYQATRLFPPGSTAGPSATPA